MTWAAFLARHKPVTSKANPACMSITSTPARTTNVKFKDICSRHRLSKANASELYRVN